MSIVWVHRKHTTPEWREDANGWEYWTEIYEVLTDSMSDGPAAVKGASAGGVTVPARLESHPDKSTAKCTDKEARRDERQPLLWRVTCEFSTEVGSSDPESQDGSIKGVLPRIRSYPEFEEVPFLEDQDDQKVTNSAGDWFDPPLTTRETIIVVEIEREEWTYDAGIASSWIDVTNDDMVWGLPPGKIKVSSITAERQADETLGIYWLVRYVLKIRKDGWLRNELDRGRNELDEPGLGGTMAGDWQFAPKHRIVDSEGVPVDRDVLLDGHGQKTTIPTDLTFREFEPRPFAPLHLPDFQVTLPAG